MRSQNLINPKVGRYNLAVEHSTNHSTKWLGLREYQEVWMLQQKFQESVRSYGSSVILGCEHPAVITCGRRSSPMQESMLPIVQTNRGGLMTVHSPGQLVIYPICSLRKLKMGVREWVEALLEITSLSLKKCNIMFIHKNNGLYTEHGKIASVGIKISKAISLHGVAINVSNDLDIFKLIDPCGHQGQPMDRVQNHNSQISTELLFRIWCDSFKNLTGSTIVNTNYASSIGSLGAVGSAFP